MARLLVALTLLLTACLSAPTHAQLHYGAGDEVYPEYDLTAPTTWVSGADDLNTAATYNFNPGTEDARWVVGLQALYLAPGTYTLTDYIVRPAAWWDSSNQQMGDKFFTGIRKRGTDELEAYSTPSGGTMDYDCSTYVTTNAPHDLSALEFAMTDWNGAALSGQTFTVEAGDIPVVYIAYRAMDRTGYVGTLTNYPYICTVSSGLAITEAKFDRSTTGATSDTVPWDEADLTLGTGDSPSSTAQFAEDITFTTTNHIAIQKGDDTTKFFAATDTALAVTLPFTTGDYWIVFRDVRVGTDETLTFDLDVDDAASQVGKIDFVIDMGTPDQVDFGPDGSATTVALSDGNEVDDQIDFAINVRPSADEVDLFYVNLTTSQGGVGSGNAYDIITISHYAKGAAARGAYTVSGSPTLLEITASGAGPTIDTLYVCTDLVVSLGDSNMYNYLDAAIQSEWTHPHCHWRAYSASKYVLQDLTGGAFDQESLLDTWENATPGNGDLVDMTGTLVLWGGAGTNDIINMSSPNSRIGQDELASGLLRAACTIAEDTKDRGDKLLFIAPPQHNGRTMGTYRKAVAWQFAKALKGVAWASSSPFYDPQPMLLANEDTYMTTADYVHYTAAGAAAVAKQAVGVYENNGGVQTYQGATALHYQDHR